MRECEWVIALDSDTIALGPFLDAWQTCVLGDYDVCAVPQSLKCSEMGECCERIPKDIRAGMADPYYRTLINTGVLIVNMDVAPKILDNAEELQDNRHELETKWTDQGLWGKILCS